MWHCEVFSTRWFLWNQTRHIFYCCFQTFSATWNRKKRHGFLQARFQTPLLADFTPSHIRLNYTGTWSLSGRFTIVRKSNKACPVINSLAVNRPYLSVCIKHLVKHRQHQAQDSILCLLAGFNSRGLIACHCQDLMWFVTLLIVVTACIKFSLSWLFTRNFILKRD